MSVSGNRKHIEVALLNSHNCDIECPTSKVEHEYIFSLIFVVIHAVGERGSYRFFDKNWVVLNTGDSACVLRRLHLLGFEMGRNSHYYIELIRIPQSHNISSIFDVQLQDLGDAELRLYYSHPAFDLNFYSGQITIPFDDFEGPILSSRLNLFLVVSQANDSLGIENCVRRILCLQFTSWFANFYCAIFLEVYYRWCRILPVIAVALHNLCSIIDVSAHCAISRPQVNANPVGASRFDHREICE